MFDDPIVCVPFYAHCKTIHTIAHKYSSKKFSSFTADNVSNISKNEIDGDVYNMSIKQNLL